MLGRMRMSVTEAEQSYAALSEKLFTSGKGTFNPGRIYDFLQANGKFKSEPLETHVKGLLQNKESGPETLLKDTDPKSCKVFVCAVRAEDGSTAIIRSYKSRAADRMYDHCKIWEAARATSAASTFFEPIEIGPWSQKFVDGGLKYNNPIELADTESAKLWPDDDRLIINIGTGSAPGRAIEGNIIDLAKRLADIVVDADERSERFRAAHPDMVRLRRLFRFTVTQGLGDIGLEEYKAVNRIATCTETYLSNTDVVMLVEDCVGAMKTGGNRLGIAAPGRLPGLE
jgi:predicted acylesterase/phospholipase RssA